MTRQEAGGRRQEGATLVVQTAFLGDVILSTGLLSALAERYGPVDVVTTPAAAPLLETHPAVKSVVPYDKHGSDRGIDGFFRLVRALKRRGYARAFLPHRSLRSALLARLAGIPERIGFAGGPGSWSYTRRIPLPLEGHDAERQLALADGQRDGGAEGRIARVSLGITGEDREAAGRWLRERGIPDGFVALAPGSIWGTKRWPGYLELAARLEGPVVVIGGPDDAALAERVAGAAPARAHSAAGALSLRATGALLERARVLVTNDSAPLHLAGSVGTPVVAIFGPTVPSFGFGPRGPGDQVVQRDGLECRPCSRHGPQVCPLGHHRCMNEIAVEQVVEALTVDR
jgi:heptosyltransferase II